MVPIKSRRERIILAAALLAVAAYAADRFRRKADTETGPGESVESLEARLRFYVALIEKEKELRKDYAEIAAPAAPAAPEGPSTVLREVELSARHCGVKIREIRPVTEARRGAARTPAGVSLSVDSSWEGLARFIKKIQRSPRGLRIEKMTVSSGRLFGDGLKIYFFLTVSNPDTP